MSSAAGAVTGKNEKTQKNNNDNNNNDDSYELFIFNYTLFKKLPKENQDYHEKILKRILEDNFFNLDERVIKTLEDVQSILRDYISVFFAVEGHPPPTKQIETVEYERFIVDGFCTYLGTKADPGKGCKVESSERLKKFIVYMAEKLLKIAKKIPDKLKEKMVTDETTMRIFEVAIKDLLYFYGQKTSSSILNPSDKHNPLVVLYNEINILFKKAVDGRNLIEIYCPLQRNAEERYSCGRYSLLGRCNQSKKYFILIGYTQGYYVDEISPGTYQQFTIKADLCGGRRKTRSTKTKKKRTKSRKQN